MEVVCLFVAGCWRKRDSKVISQCINKNDDCLIKALGMPASRLIRAEGVCISYVDRRRGAFGAILEDESRKEEATAEEVDGEGVEDTGE